MITVNASRKYDITVTDSWQGLAEVVGGVAKGKKIMIVTDSNVAPLYLEEVKAELASYEIYSRTVAAGESSKCIAVYAELLEDLASKAFRREDMIISLGGGVVGDLAAFAASTYMRGIRLVAVPTTLLSMIDSSVGGKTAVNLSVGKNLCGTFYQPYAVYANVSTMKTLPEREILCGKGELVKYAVLDGRIKGDDIDGYYKEEVVEKCVAIKRDIVEADEFEGGKRMLLNLGHTVGHAVEALSGYAIPHGLCVLKGLYAVAKISKKTGSLSEREYEKIKALLERVAPDEGIGYPVGEILKEIAVDKKAGGRGIKLVLIEGIGKCFVSELTMAETEKYLD